jgi:hypothetical protein
MDDAYSVNYAALQRYVNAARSASVAMMRAFPQSEADVNERVYVSLDEERRFERSARPIDEVVAELREIASAAPPGAEVLVEFDTDTGWDDDYIPVRKIGYWRDPTPEERAVREEANRKAREHNVALEECRAAEERAEFERLKAKYEKELGTGTPE